MGQEVEGSLLKLLPPSTSSTNSRNNDDDSKFVRHIEERGTATSLGQIAPELQ